MQTYITKEQGYALRICALLADLEEGEQLSIGDLSKTLFVSRKFAAGIVHKLKHKGILNTTQGRYGGVFLKESPEKLSLFHIMDAIGFRSKLNTCLVTDHICPLEKDCAFFTFFDEIERDMLNSFKQKKIVDFKFKKDTCPEEMAKKSSSK